MICELHESSLDNLVLVVVNFSHHKNPAPYYGKAISLEDIDFIGRYRFDGNFVANIRYFLSFLTSQLFEPDIVHISSNAVHPYFHINFIDYTVVDINSQICIGRFLMANQRRSLLIHDWMKPHYDCISLMIR
jgi:hypothetical protein